MSKLFNLLDAKFWKFIIVGVINTIVGTAIMFGFYNFLHFSYWTSSAANYILTSILSFFLNKYFTFQHKGSSWKSALRFAVNIAVCYLLAYGIAKPVTLLVLADTGQRLQENVAMFVGMVLFTLLNYIGQRFFAFK
ncbi:GtrA family protein [Ureibacillus chungkukjangi]|uniref:Putative flippase GtrA n=1 Tax=Ureibacillus chungkukjangi TaxID=1202712 RepID=A0A318TT94_9BACL|nr:GtrA family protein [Ureibacillus chungkukjangi]PYF07583.1 putative flippase GtrA [Ureibacillus chungkukjangi]